MAGIYLNEDNSHYFYTRREKSSDPNEIKNFIYQYKGSNVEKFIINANSQKTSFRSSSWESIYDNVDLDSDFFVENKGLKGWMLAVKDVAEKGIDIYSIWINALREINISPWISMRMNDVHNANDIHHPMHNMFYKNNLSYRRAMYRDKGWEDRQLNYLIKDVWDYHFNLVLEYFEKFDFDGIELDWMRFGNHFPTGWADEGRAVINEFMQKTKETAKRYEKVRGHAIEIGARVPVDPVTAFDMGMDAFEWADKGYVSYVAPSPFWETSQHDIPVEMWKKLMKGTGVKVVPCIEICLRQTRFPHCKNKYQFNTLETMRANASTFIDRGADGIYLFNYMDYQEFAYSNEEYFKMVNEIGRYDIMVNKPKRYILTFNDRKADGKPFDVRLPDRLTKDDFHEYRLHTGSLKGIHESKHIILSFAQNEEISETDADVYINGIKCNFSGMINIPDPKPVYRTYGWAIPEEAFKNGYQIIEIVPKADGLVAEWVEIYLM